MRRFLAGSSWGRRLRGFDVGALFGRIAGFAARRAIAVVAAVAALSLASALLALRLDPSAAIDTLVDRDSTSFQATETFHRDFGDEPVVVLIRGSLANLLLTPDLARIVALEGCISGKVPPGVKPPVRECEQFAASKPVQVVYGPGTFINESVRQISQQFEAERGQRAAQAERAARAARALAKAQGKSEAEQEKLARGARQLVYAQFVRKAYLLALRYGLTSAPALNNPDFVSKLVFDPMRPGVPKARFAYLFPNARSALIQARLRPDLSESERRRAIELVRQAVAEPRFRLQRGSYVVSGIPVVAQGATSSITHALVVLLVASLLVMAATLALVFRSRLRLLPLALALAACALTFGAMSLAGASLTMASIAVLPVLIGLAVDYAIQFHARFNEVRAGGAQPLKAAPIAAAAGAPVIAAAGAATAVGFLVMLLSPVPMVRSFGLLLVLGIALAFASTLTAGFAVLGGTRRFPRVGRTRLRAIGDVIARLPWPAARAGELLRGTANRLSGAANRLSASLKDTSRRSLSAAIRRPEKVLAIAGAVAVIGWLADTQTKVVSDIQRLLPGSLQELKDINTLQRETGVSGDIDVVVRSDHLTEPGVIAWMADYQKRVLGRHGYKQGRSCQQAELCPALSLTNLFGSDQRPSAKRVRALLDALPSYFSRSLITRDRRVANISFGIRVMPLDEQKKLIDDMRAQLDPPAGVHAELAGLPVLAAEANADLSSSRRVLTLAGLAAVFVVLLAVYRRSERAIVPLIPIALATGWSALVLFLIRVPLNPMSATLGALVIAVSTEFSVILSARYRQERAAGAPPPAALERTYARTGPAVLASGATVIAGFAALIASNVPMLRDFGFVTVVDLTVALLGVMVVLPAALVWGERRGWLIRYWTRWPRSRAEAARRARALVRAAGSGLAALSRRIRTLPVIVRRGRGETQRP